MSRRALAAAAAAETARVYGQLCPEYHADRRPTPHPVVRRKPLRVVHSPKSADPHPVDGVA